MNRVRRDRGREGAGVAEDIQHRLAIVVAHPDDEVLWAGSMLRAAERIVVVYGQLPCQPDLTAGRRAAMADFPLPTLDWLQLVESGVFDSASWPDPRETAYGLYPHRRLGMLECFDPDGYRAKPGELRDRLRTSLRGMKNVIVHSPWGEYGHEDHVQIFRVVAGLAPEMGFQVWVPGYYGPKSERLMRRNLRFLGRPTAKMPVDRALAEEISQIYKRTGTWTWFDDYVWPETEWFFPWRPGAVRAAERVRPDDLQSIAFPAAYLEAMRRPHPNRRRELWRKLFSWINGLLVRWS